MKIRWKRAAASGVLSILVSIGIFFGLGLNWPLSTASKDLLVLGGALASTVAVHRRHMKSLEYLIDWIAYSAMVTVVYIPHSPTAGQLLAAFTAAAIAIVVGGLVHAVSNSRLRAEFNAA